MLGRLNFASTLNWIIQSMIPMTCNSFITKISQPQSIYKSQFMINTYLLHKCRTNIHELTKFSLLHNLSWNYCKGKLTSLRVLRISFKADGATASWDMSFCRQDSPITLNFTVLTSQAIRKIFSISSLCAISLGLDNDLSCKFSTIPSSNSHLVKIPLLFTFNNQNGIEKQIWKA